MIMGEDEQSVGKHTVALVVLDRATRFMGGYPAVTNSTQTTVSGLQSFYSTVVPKLFIQTTPASCARHVTFLTTPRIPRLHIDLSRMVWQSEQLGDVKKEHHVKYSSQASWPRGGIGQCQFSVRSTTSQKRLWSKVALK